MDVAWYFDVVSPFAYIALGEVEALERRSPVAYRPVLLGAMLGHWGQLGPAEVAPKRVQTYRMCQWKAREKGLGFRFPPAHPFNPLPYLRLLTALGARPGAVRATFDLIWREGRDPASPATMGLLCERLGVADPEGLIARSGAKDRLRAITDEAIAKGVFGVPTLAIGPELFWGSDAMTMALAYLDDPALFDDPEMRRLDTLPKGVERPRR
jgi:2-hydroxychromene-2-carboxylate isomerase